MPPSISSLLSAQHRLCRKPGALYFGVWKACEKTPRIRTGYSKFSRSLSRGKRFFLYYLGLQSITANRLIRGFCIQIEIIFRLILKSWLYINKYLWCIPVACNNILNANEALAMLSLSCEFLPKSQASILPCFHGLK